MGEYSNPSKGRLRIVSQVLQGPSGQTAEIVRSVNGLSSKEIEDGAISISYLGKPMWFLSPIALFQAKLANVNTLPQAGRQDLRHLQLLVPVTRCFFSEILNNYNRPERPTAVLTWLNQHVKNLRTAEDQGHLPSLVWKECLPMEEMANHVSPSIANFRKQLES